MLSRQAGLLIVVVGVAAALLGALANPLGIGNTGFGWKQGVLLGVGIVVAVIGAAVVMRAPSSATAPGSEPGSDAAPGSEPGSDA